MLQTPAASGEFERYREHQVSNLKDMAGTTNFPPYLSFHR
jgi:hypothetical protein